VRYPKKGFTIVELLVVIAIIAVLMTILVPALAQAKRQAQATICLTRLKAFGQALVMYAGENKDMVPRGSSGAAQDWHWPALFMPYAGGSTTDPDQWFEAKIFDCPAFPVKDQCLDYCMNAWNITNWNRLPLPTSDTTAEQRGPTKVHVFERPETTIYITDFEYNPAWEWPNQPGGYLPVIRKADDPPLIRDKMRWFDLWFPTQMPLPRDVNAADYPNRRVARQRHKIGANALLVDGHSEWVSTAFNNRWLWGALPPQPGDVDYVPEYTKLH